MCILECVLYDSSVLYVIDVLCWKVCALRVAAPMIAAVSTWLAGLRRLECIVPFVCTFELAGPGGIRLLRRVSTVLVTATSGRV